jgi:hypothetical protein
LAKSPSSSQSVSNCWEGDFSIRNFRVQCALDFLGAGKWVLPVSDSNSISVLEDFLKFCSHCELVTSWEKFPHGEVIKPITITVGEQSWTVMHSWNSTFSTSNFPCAYQMRECRKEGRDCQCCPSFVLWKSLVALSTELENASLLGTT